MRGEEEAATSAINQRWPARRVAPPPALPRPGNCDTIFRFHFGFHRVHCEAQNI